MISLRKLTERGDFVLISITVLLVGIGLTILSSASSALAFSTFDDSFHFLKQQSIFAVVGLGVMFFFMLF